MSANSGRAAVFTQQSQSVEVYLDGTWEPGSLLGWRHDGVGACQVWVRTTVDGREQESWTDLADVRLPETRPAPTLVPQTGTDPFADLAEELLPGASAAPVLSLSEAAAREQRLAGAAPGAAPSPGPLRRHGADLTAEMSAVHLDPAAGRHRAAGMSGRHRAADTGAQRTAVQQTAVQQPLVQKCGLHQPAAQQTVSKQGAEPRREVGDATVLMPRAAEADFLTRPLRLGDRASRPRPTRSDEAMRA